MMHNKITIVFLILNYKTFTETIRLVEEIQQMEFKNSRIVVVDNMSPNESFNTLKRTFSSSNEVDIIQASENGGYAKGNNYGLRYIEKYAPEYICIVNNDVRFSKDTISSLMRLYKTLQNPAIIAPVQLLPNGNKASYPTFYLHDYIYDVMSYINHKRKYEQYPSLGDNSSHIKNVDIIPGSFMFADFNILRSVGYFDESTFLFLEERFLARRIKEAGLKNYLILDQTYLHEHSKTINNCASTKQQRKYLFDGKIAYTRKYYTYKEVKVLLLTLAYIYSEMRISFIGRLNKILFNGHRK